MENTGYYLTEVTYEAALELFDNEEEVFLLYDDGTEGLVEDRESIHRHNGYGGLFGVE